MNKIKICVAGATGWAGSELSRGIAAANDLELVAAISRRQAGKDLCKANSQGYSTTRTSRHILANLTGEIGQIDRIHA